MRTGSFQAAWCLGVLCTSTAKPAVLAELHRVLHPAGQLGLLVFVATSSRLPSVPEGNEFPTMDGLCTLFA